MDNVNARILIGLGILVLAIVVLALTLPQQKDDENVILVDRAITPENEQSEDK